MREQLSQLLGEIPWALLKRNRTAEFLKAFDCQKAFEIRAGLLALCEAYVDDPSDVDLLSSLEAGAVLADAIRPFTCSQPVGCVPQPQTSPENLAQLQQAGIIARMRAAAIGCSVDSLSKQSACAS